MRRARRAAIAVLNLTALLTLIGCTQDATGPLGSSGLSLLVVSGGGQSGVVGSELPQPLVIKATRANGSPLINIAVNFHVTSGGGAMFAGTSVTDAKGIAKDYWTLGTSTAELQRVEVRAVLSSGEKQVYGTFTATALAGPAARIEASAGDGQTALAGAAVATAPAVRVSDQYGNPVPQVVVTFAIATGGGSVSGPNQTTDAAGLATVGGWTLGLQAGANSLTATSLGSGISGNPVTFSATATGGAALAWTALVPAGLVPPSRAGHSAVLSASGSMVVFGGFRNGIGNVNDVWLLEHPLGTGGSAIWSPIAPNGSAPAPRAFHSAVIDRSNDPMIVFGGDGAAGALNDVWVLENASASSAAPAWTQLQPTGAAPAARFYHSAVYDPTSNRMIVFGGGNLHFATTFYDDVWVLTNANGLGGTPAWIQLTPGGTPGARTLHSAVYDAQFNRMTVFGGQNSSSVRLNDVWVLFNANGAGLAPAWVQITPTGAPPAPRIGHTAVYDPVSFRMTIFGGFEDFGTDNQTWVLTFANAVPGASPAWLQLAPAGPLPPARWTHSAVYDPASNRMTVFGGRDDLNDTWVLGDANGSP